MHFLLFDDRKISSTLQPFTFTRPVANIRIGIYTMAERWAKMLGTEVVICGSERSNLLFPIPMNLKEAILINAAWIPNEQEIAIVLKLQEGESVWKADILLATFCQNLNGFKSHFYPDTDIPKTTLLPDAELITQPWEIFSKNGKVLRTDFELVKNGRESEAITDPFTIVYGRENIFLEEGVDIKATVLNASEGPIYIGKNAQIQEGSVIKGPFALLNNSVVNMGAKIRPDTTVGPYCKVGGEISNAVFFGYSNKAHDGFLGNSVIGEWCNLGASTNNSNLKNNYSEVKVYSYDSQKMVSTGLQFCGLLMGDHSKTSINSMFNTGTVVGIGCNIFDGGFPPKHVISFSWGGGREGFEMYQFDKFIEAEKRVFARRNLEMSLAYINVLRILHLEKEKFFKMHANPLFGN